MAIIETPTGSIDTDKLASIPPRIFRSAWRLQGAVVVVDMPAARALHRGRMRIVRGAVFPRLDGDQLRAIVASDSARTAESEAVKQALRDCPTDPAIAAATTPEALRAVWPEIILGRYPAELGPDAQYVR